MGLDMYLDAKKRMYPKWASGGREDTEEMKKIRQVMPEIYKSGNLDYIVIQFEAGYWRKANHIHKWFVDNVQNGVDNCERYYVSREDIEKLLKVVNTVLQCSEKIEGTVNQGWRYTQEKGKEELTKEGMVLANPAVAKKLLPTAAGFFFGNTDYDEYYHQDLIWTKEVLERALKLGEEWEYEYHSSW